MDECCKVFSSFILVFYWVSNKCKCFYILLLECNEFNFELIILDVWMNVTRCLVHLFWFSIDCQINVNVYIYCCLNKVEFNLKLIILDVWMNIARCLVHLFWFFTKCHVNVNVFIYCNLNVSAWKIDHLCKCILFWEYMFKVSPFIIEQQIYASCYLFLFYLLMYVRVFFPKFSWNMVT
jgi:hypothetical protein